MDIGQSEAIEIVSKDWPKTALPWRANLPMGRSAGGTSIHKLICGFSLDMD